jgi:hypothetical protein
VPLAGFYTAHFGTSFDKFRQVDRQIALGHYYAANTINNGIVPVNIVETNQQKVNYQILQKLNTPSYAYSTVDVTDLNNIAIQCPLSGGNAVYQARITLMTMANDVIEFIDNCDKGQRSLIQSHPVTENGDFNFRLYPNPNDGNMTFDYSSPDYSNGKLMLYDVTGRFVNSYNLNEGLNNSLKISEDQLQNGIYIYKIFVNNEIIASDRVVIVK